FKRKWFVQKCLNHSLQHKKAPNYLLGAFL
ncbi:MAG: hypothetical protein ACI9MD_001703, partial [Psychrobacter glaciei]